MGIIPHYPPQSCYTHTHTHTTCRPKASQTRKHLTAHSEMHADFHSLPSPRQSHDYMSTRGLRCLRTHKTHALMSSAWGETHSNPHVSLSHTHTNTHHYLHTHVGSHSWTHRYPEIHAQVPTHLRTAGHFPALVANPSPSHTYVCRVGANSADTLTPRHAHKRTRGASTSQEHPVGPLSAILSASVCLSLSLCLCLSSTTCSPGHTGTHTPAFSFPHCQTDSITGT